jgi:hypothetical protein
MVMKHRQEKGRAQLKMQSLSWGFILIAIMSCWLVTANYTSRIGSSLFGQITFHASYSSDFSS